MTPTPGCELWPVFQLDEMQCHTLRDWLIDHDKTCPHANPRKQGASGGRLTIAFTPTSLFTHTEVQCACGAKVDLTDYDAV